MAIKLSHPDLWIGGHYELAVELGEPNDERLTKAARSLWTQVATDPPGAVSLDALLAGTIKGAARLATGELVPCGLFAWREVEVVDAGFYGPDWLTLAIPLAGLNNAGIATGGYPFGDYEASRQWREPLDSWLAGIGMQLFDTVPYRLALVGMEVGGEAYSDRLDSGVPADHHFGYLVPGANGLRYYAATE